jgi:adenylate kinase
LVQRLLERGKTSGRIDDQDEEKLEIATKNTTKTAPLMDYYKNQNKYFAVNGIGSITEITERVSSVIDQL